MKKKTNMRIQTAKRLVQFPEYIFSRLAKAVREVEKESKRKVLDFGAGSPDIKPNEQYINALVEFIRANDSHKYPGYGAIKEFSAGLIFWYKKRFNVILSEEELLPLLGAKDGISHLPLAILDEKDEVLLPDPGYPVFNGPLVMFGIIPVTYELTEENNFKIDLIELEKKVTEKTKCIWVNFPSNPTGQVTTLDELEKIVFFAKKHNIILIYDNAYSEVTFDGYIAPSVLQIPEAKEIAVEIGSFSKTFSFAGYRMGWIVGNKTVIAALSKVKSQMDSGMSIPLQKLGGYALTHFDKKWRENMIEDYQKRRNVIVSYLKKLGLQFSIPKGALYIWAKIPYSYRDSEEFCMKMLKEKQVLFTPGTAFGTNGKRYVRISICVNIDNIKSYFS